MATAAPSPQSNPPDPQITSSQSTTVSNVSLLTFAQNDPAGYREYEAYRAQAERALFEKYDAEEKENFGPIASATRPRRDAVRNSGLAANQQFASQIIAAGAGTATTTTDPLLPQQPQPPSGPATPVNSAANPQVPPPPRAFPNPAPGESRLVNTLEDFGPVTNPPIVVPTPAPTPVDPVNITGDESAFVPTPPDPLATPGAVNPATNAQVTSAPGLTSTTVTNVNEGKFRADDPQGYAQFKAFEKQQQAEEVARLTAITQEQSGRNFLTARERSIVNADAATLAREDAIKKFTPQIQNAGAAIQTTTQGPAGQVKTAIPGPVDPATDPASREFVNTGGGAATGIRRVPARPAVQEAAARNNARAQPQVQNQRAQAAGGDWRLKLRLAPGSDYLYNAGEPGILQPLKVTDGVIFPYTPAITTTYTALYNNYDLTHSNYKGYFYQGSHVGELNITATFTAQDSNEAAYLLAVIQFFRSVTKMFYGQQDSFRGSPPPLVFLQGYGDFQFNLNPCVVQTFNYNLPADVDYIRAGAPNINGTNLLQRRDRQTATVGTNNPSASRMSAAGLSPGGTRPPPPPTTLGRAQPTYVPTKMEITLVLLPMQTRSQVSREFSMEKFANGSLVQRGFW